MRVEAELVRRPVDEAAREDPVERGPGGEGTLQQRDARVAEQAAQDCSAHRKRQVRDDREGLGRQRHQRRVAGDHLNARVGTEALLQLQHRRRVELDRAHAGTRIRERARQDAAAGAEVEHERAGQDAGVADELVCESATTKGVATTRPRLR